MDTLISKKPISLSLHCSDTRHTRCRKCVLDGNL